MFSFNWGGKKSSKEDFGAALGEKSADLDPVGTVQHLENRAKSLRQANPESEEADALETQAEEIRNKNPEKFEKLEEAA
jgi:hypothetical protein